MSTSPVAAEVTTTGSSPSESNFGANAVPSSMSAPWIGGGELFLEVVTAIKSSRPLRSQAAALRGKHHETCLLCRVFLEDAGELGGYGGDIGFLHAADRHALMYGLDHHRHALRLQRLVDGLGDLRRHGLLGLQAPGEHLDHAGKLGDTDDAVGREISYMRLADERDHVMFAMRMQLDIAQHYDVVITGDLVEGAGQHVEWALVVASEELVIGANDALWRLAQAFASRIVAGIGDQRADGFFGFHP